MSAGNPGETYLFTFKAEDWNGFEKFLNKWSADHSATEKWSSGSSKSIPAGAPIFLMKQGRAPTGIIAAGFTASKNRPYRRWSKRKGKTVPGRANTLRFAHFLNPEEDHLLDISDLPKQYWAARGSGVRLPTEISREIRKRWTALLGANDRESEKAHKAPTLEAGDGSEVYKVSNRDTRATALRQIRERRGQSAFRQNLIRMYEGMCAISGCQVTDVLEAAHIKPYLGDNDNNSQNGLLLRADLHTLFDLLLIGIHPSKRTVHLHRSLRGSEYDVFDGKPLRLGKSPPSFEALRMRWREFKHKAD